MNKTRTPTSAVPESFGTSMEGLKHDVAALLSPIQQVLGDIRKELPSGERVKAALHETGLDKTWDQLKQAATSVVQPLLTPAKTVERRPLAAKKAVKKTARKVAGKASSVKKKVAKKAK
ncbi:MAG: hypothetical protein JWR15_1564 [Prosthecobacter sp.]|nr:hypothetical protein [Prosthecobacter sp.]